MALLTWIKLDGDVRCCCSQTKAFFQSSTEPAPSGQYVNRSLQHSLEVSHDIISWFYDAITRYKQ